MLQKEYNIRQIPGFVQGFGLFILSERIAGSTLYYYDIPLVVKVGYDFNWFQVDLSYKNGFKRIYWNHVVGNTETRDLQLSIFVPIFK